MKGQKLTQPRSLRLLRAVFEHPYTQDHCFLCAGILRQTDRTAEHVIPKWLQDEFGLWNQRLVLPNGTSIPYRQLTIPCCKRCNNVTLSKIEPRIRKFAQGKFETANRAPKILWFAWLAKIYLGLQFRDLSLLWDRKNPQAGTLLTAEAIKGFLILHFWLQIGAARLKKNGVPASIFLFRTQSPENQKDQFDLMDDVAGTAIAIRMGRLGIVADFLENGHHIRMAQTMVAKYQKVELHPQQFRELACTIFYASRLLNVETEFEFFTIGEKLGFTYNVKGTGPDGLIKFQEWRQPDFAAMLSHYMDYPYEKIYYPPNQVRSWLHTSDGKIVDWKIGQEHPHRTPN